MVHSVNAREKEHKSRRSTGTKKKCQQAVWSTAESKLDAFLLFLAYGLQAAVKNIAGSADLLGLKQTAKRVDLQVEAD